MSLEPKRRHQLQVEKSDLLGLMLLRGYCTKMRAMDFGHMVVIGDLDLSFRRLLRIREG